MDRQNLTPILIAILVAALLTYFILSWTDSSRKKPVTKQFNQTFSKELKVLVAADNLVLGRRIRHIDLKWQAWPKETISKTYIIENTRQIDHFIGMVVKNPINKGSPIISENIIQPANRSALAAVIKPGMRAVAIEVNESTGVAGFIFPGDYVDINATIQTNNELEPIAVKSILKNVLVLAIDQITSRDASATAKIVKTITIEVQPQYVMQITQAKAAGQVSLSLQGLLE